MKIREFVNNIGQKYVVKENEDGSLNIDFVPFSMRVNDWSFIDTLKDRGQLHYKHQYDAINKRY